MYEVFEHTADVGLRFSAQSAEALLVDAGHGLVSLLTPDQGAIEPTVTAQWTVEADEWPLLLFDHLAEALYRFETERLLFSTFTVTIDSETDPSGQPRHIAHVTARGEPLDPSRHRFGQEVKAITYHGLTMDPPHQDAERDASVWQGQVIIDI